MNSFFDTLFSFVAWPFVCLWQMFDEAMNRLLVFSVSVPLFLIALVLWSHFLPAPKPVALIQSAPAAVIAPAAPYYDSRYPGAMTLESPADRK